LALPEETVRPALLGALISLAGCGLLGGCASVPVRVESYRLPVPPQGLVLVVNGAGGTPEAVNAVAAAVEQSGTPLYVRTFAWSHPRGVGLADMTDIEHARTQGRLLAAHIAWYRSTYPSLPIYVVAYSAGSHVALAAARSLEPNSVERMVLLAPAVAADYDLRPALAASRQGMDVFTSERDRFYLGVGTRVVGTADGKLSVPPAGRGGFDTPPLTGADAALAQRLRQHPWDASVAWAGNNGSHDGSLRPAYFRAYVLPLLTPSSAAK
jgi:pimeloyl-ACP methyl ester carboxylesterase